MDQFVPGGRYVVLVHMGEDVLGGLLRREQASRLAELFSAEGAEVEVVGLPGNAPTTIVELMAADPDDDETLPDILNTSAREDWLAKHPRPDFGETELL